MKLRKYDVVLSTSKTIQIMALDEEDAMEKAELRVNKTNNKWLSDTASEVK